MLTISLDPKPPIEAGRTEPRKIPAQKVTTEKMLKSAPNALRQHKKELIVNNCEATPMTTGESITRSNLALIQKNKIGNRHIHIRKIK